MTQAIGLALEIFGFAALVALATSFCLTWLGRRFLPAALASHVVLPFAVAIAYFAGYLTLPRSFAVLLPQQGQAWPWLPYLGLLSAVAASILPTSKSYLWLISLLAIAALAAAALSPTWPVYGFTRVPLALFLVAYLLAISVPLYQLLARPLNNRSLYFLIAICVLNALAIGAMYSTRHAQLAALPAGALTGISLALFMMPKDSDLALRRLAPLFATLVGGVAWLACVEPDPPKPILLAIPLLCMAIIAIPTPFRSPPDRLD